MRDIFVFSMLVFAALAANSRDDKPARHAPSPTSRALGLQVSQRSNLKGKSTSYFAICAIVRDQHLDVLEWIEWHRCIGVEKFYIYDNNSTMPFLFTLWRYIDADIVDYSHIRGWKTKYYGDSVQWWAYHDCVRRHRGRHQFLGFFDSDEYIVFPKQQPTVPNINDFLRDFEGYGGLALNWRVFGSSGHLVRPDGPVPGEYTKALRAQSNANRHVKSIGNVRFMKDISKSNPHVVAMMDSNQSLVDENFFRVGEFPRTERPTHQKIAVFHYVLKSKEEFAGKVSRGSPDGGGKSWSYFERIDKDSNTTCQEAIWMVQACHMKHIVRDQRIRYKKMAMLWQLMNIM